MNQRRQSVDPPHNWVCFSQQRRSPTRWLRCVCLAVVLMPSAGKSEPAKKEPTTSEKLLGTWEVTKSDTAPVGAILEFKKDGTMKLTVTENGKEASMECKYKVDGDTITATYPDGRSQPGKIRKLTNKELVIEVPKGKTDEYKRK
jgi:uncharacterized protein (TIGR03066 family)